MSELPKEKKGKMVTFYESPGDPLTPEQRKNIDELLANPNREIDFSDIPETPPGFWKNAVRGGSTGR